MSGLVESMLPQEDGQVIEIQVLSPDDWPQWRELRRAALAETPEAFGSSLADWSGPGDTPQRWRARLADVPLNLVLRLDRRPAGMVSAVPTADPGEVEVISLWVAPAARGRGVGDAALREVLDWAERRGARSVVLSVRAQNAPAVRLYRRHGFVDAGVPPDDPAGGLLRRVLTDPAAASTAPSDDQR